jgi:hypothetical protein
MGIKLYVGSLPYSVNDQSLQEMFSPFGTVDSAKVIMDRYSGQAKGSALWKWPMNRRGWPPLKNSTVPITAGAT